MDRDKDDDSRRSSGEAIRACPEEQQVTKRRTASSIRARDGGWGWVVAASSFIVHVIADGILLSYGVIFVALLDDFQSGASETSWILSIFVSLTLGSGMLAGALVKKYNCRTVTIAGAVIGSAGFLVSPYAPGLWFLYISLGMVAGIGFGLINLPSVVILGYYFEKKQALATGLATSGSGLGAFLFAPFMEYLISEYGWKQMCFILSGVILNIAVCGALYRPSFIERKHNVSQRRQSLPFSDTTALQQMPHPKEGDIRFSDDRHRYQEEVLAIRDVESEVDRCQQYATFESIHTPLLKKNDSYGSIFATIQPTVGACRLMEKPRSCASCGLGATVSAVKETLDLHLLRDAVFVIFIMSNFFTNLGFDTPFLFVPDRALSDGVASSQKAAFLSSAIGISDTAGRLVFGITSNVAILKPYRLYIYILGLISAGVATALSVLSSEYWVLVLYSCVYGFCIGCYVSMTPVILVDLFGIEKLTGSFGMTSVAQAVGVTIGPPVCGALYDFTNSYRWPFIATGVSICISGIILFTVPCLLRSITIEAKQPKAE